MNEIEFMNHNCGTYGCAICENLKAALKLQELVKEWLEETKQPIPEGHIPLISLGGLTQKLQSLVKESEK